MMVLYDKHKIEKNKPASAGLHRNGFSKEADVKQPPYLLYGTRTYKCYFNHINQYLKTKDINSLAFWFKLKYAFASGKIYGDLKEMSKRTGVSVYLVSKYYKTLIEHELLVPTNIGYAIKGNKVIQAENKTKQRLKIKIDNNDTIQSIVLKLRAVAVFTLAHRQSYVAKMREDEDKARAGKYVPSRTYRKIKKALLKTNVSGTHRELPIMSARYLRRKVGLNPNDFKKMQELTTKTYGWKWYTHNLGVTNIYDPFTLNSPNEEANKYLHKWTFRGNLYYRLPSVVFLNQQHNNIINNKYNTITSN